MKSMEQFGMPLIGYEGVAHVTFEERDAKIATKGYFEAARYSSGRTAISVIPTDIRRPAEISFTVDANGEISFLGRGMDGWIIRLGGQTFFSRLSWLFASIAGPPAEMDLSAQFMEVQGDGALEDGYSRVQFVISNSLWNDRSEEEPEPSS